MAALPFTARKREPSPLALTGTPTLREPLTCTAMPVTFITGDAVTDEDVKEAILQICSEIDKPETPGPAAP